MCNFHAEEKLRRRRLIAQDMTISMERAGALIHDIDEERWNHEETTGCKCWYEAIAKNQSRFSEVA